MCTSPQHEGLLDELLTTNLTSFWVNQHIPARPRIRRDARAVPSDFHVAVRPTHCFRPWKLRLPNCPPLAVQPKQVPKRSVCRGYVRVDQNNPVIRARDGEFLQHWWSVWSRSIGNLGVDNHSLTRALSRSTGERIISYDLTPQQLSWTPHGGGTGRGGPKQCLGMRSNNLTCSQPPGCPKFGPATPTCILVFGGTLTSE